VERIYALGHPRFNLHFGLCMITTFFLREHNLVAELLHKENPEWTDERIFQTTRIVLIAELSKMVVEDYINHILGKKNIRINYHPQMLFHTEFQYTERAHFEFNYLYSKINLPENQDGILWFLLISHWERKLISFLICNLNQNSFKNWEWKSHLGMF
jgi:hypothetical protein